MQIGPATSYFPSLTAMRQSTPSPTAPSPATGSGFEAALAAVTPQPKVNDAQRYAPQGANLLSHLTPADRQLLEAATGYKISSDGEVLNPGTEPVDSMIVMMAIQRESGQLTGEVTAGYMTNLFKQYGSSSDMGGSFSSDRLDKAPDFFADRDARRAQGITQSSFNVGV